MLTKLIIPAAGLGTRFLPLTKNCPKEMLPLVDKPLLAYLVEEAKLADLKEMIVILSKDKKDLLNYFQSCPCLEKTLQERNQQEKLECLAKEKEKYSDLDFKIAFQPNPLGDGDAVSKAKKLIGKDNFAVAFPDDIFYSQTPALEQLLKVFATSQKPVIGLKKVEAEKLSSYGVVKVEKIANKLYQIKDIIEKPKKGEEPSSLAVCGRYALDNETLNYLSKVKPNQKGEIILAEAFKEMLLDGKVIYGVELEGEWLECGKIIDWLKSNLFMCLRHQDYAPILKKYLKTL